MEHGVWSMERSDRSELMDYFTKVNGAWSMERSDKSELME
jgi:hypothetical protein